MWGGGVSTFGGVELGGVLFCAISSPETATPPAFAALPGAKSALLLRKGEGLRRHPLLDELERARGELEQGLLVEALDRYARALAHTEGRRPDPSLSEMVVTSHFNAARVASLLAGPERAEARARLVATALDHLEEAERLGLKYLDYLDQAPELEPLRGEARFQALLDRLKARR